jgi:hypothetical protein
MEEKLKEKCDARESCRNEATEEHTCPFLEEIHNNSATLCNCCDRCRHECAMDI